MIVIFLLIPLSVVIATGFLFAFIWAVRSGQYEDTYTPSLRVLLQDLPGVRPAAGRGSRETDHVEPDSLAAPAAPNPFPLTPKKTNP